MDTVFLKLFNMSICAGWLILAIIVLRLLLRRGPKWVRCVLWAFVAIRLICPFSLTSMFSLIPSARTVRTYDVQYAASPEIHSGITAIDNTLNPVIRESFAPNPGASANPLQIWTMIAGILWLIGLLALSGYALLGFIRLRQTVSEAVRLQGDIFVCDHVHSPFILGIIHPVIYLPSGLDEDATRYVLAHEQAHLMRRDHWWKTLGFFLLAVYWFHPLVWAAYVLFCRDIELACDEKAIKNWNLEKKKAYSHALVSCSMQRKTVLSCPLAFGEVGIRARVKAVLHYKKPTLAVMTLSAVICALVAVCFLTNPTGEAKERQSQSGITDMPAKPESGAKEAEQTDTDEAGAKSASADDPEAPANHDPADTRTPDNPEMPANHDPADAQTPNNPKVPANHDPADAQTPNNPKVPANHDPADAQAPDNPPAPTNNNPTDTQTPDGSSGARAVNTGYPLYDSLIARAAHVLAHPQEAEYEYERTLFSSVYFYGDTSWQTPGYLLMDLDGNGVDELLFGENHDGDWNGIVFNIYTIADKSLVRLADGWERNRYYLCENGCIANEGSSGASESTYSYYTYEGTALTLVESVVYDASSDPENPWFYTTDDPYSTTAQLTSITESDAREIMSQYVHVLPQFTPFPKAE